MLVVLGGADEQHDARHRPRVDAVAFPEGRTRSWERIADRACAGVEAGHHIVGRPHDADHRQPTGRTGRLGPVFSVAA